MRLTRIRNIVDDNDTVSASVVTRGDGPESFLSSSVPLFGIECRAITGIVEACRWTIR